MKKDLIEKLYKLLSSPNGGKLAFKMANSLGYTDEGLIQLIWDKYSKNRMLVLQGLAFYRRHNKWGLQSMTCQYSKRSYNEMVVIFINELKS